MTTPKKTRDDWADDLMTASGFVTPAMRKAHTLRIIDEITVEALEEARGIHKACAHREFNERITARINQINGACEKET